MKLLLIASDYAPLKGGVSTALGRFAQAYSKEEIFIMAPSANQATCEKNMMRLGLTHGQNRVWRFFQTLHWLGHAWEILVKEKIDLIVIGCLSPLGFIGSLLLKFTGVPYVVIAHASEIPIKEISSKGRCAIGRKILQKANVVLTISEYTDKRVKAIAPKARTRRIEYGVDSKLFHPTPKEIEFVKRLALEGKKVLLCFSRLIRRKGMDKAIEAFALLRKERKDLALLIAGDGEDRDYLKQHAREHGVESEVVFYGLVEKEDLLKVYSLADVMLFLSRQEGYDVEGFGLVVLEASACQKAIIAGRSGGIPDAVLEEQTGLLVDPTKVDDIVSAIKRLLDHPEQAEKLAKAAREFAESRTWEKFYKNVRETLESYCA